MLLTTVLVEAMQFGSSKLVGTLALSDKYPILLTRYGPLLPIGCLVAVAGLATVLVLLVLFRDDTCDQLLKIRIASFAYNVIYRYIFPGVIIKYATWVGLSAIGKHVDQTAALDELFERKEHILQLRQQKAAEEGQEPLLE